MALLIKPFRAAAATLVAVAAFASPAVGQITQEQALDLAFGPAAEVERRTAYLDDAQLEEAQRLAGPLSEVDQGIVTYYVGMQAGRPAGVAYFDAHRVRTLQEVLMVVVDLDGTVVRVETVSFREPPEYEAPEGWLEQFVGRELGPGLSTRGDIAPMTGATLTANAVTRAVRRVLALHQVVEPFGSDPP